MITGSIVERDLSTSIGGPPTIHVKEVPNEECGVIFLVRTSTQIRRRTVEGSVVSAPLSDLTVGRRVRVWAELVYDSCPGQSIAVAVEILDSP